MVIPETWRHRADDRITPEQVAVETEPKPVLALIEEEADQLGIVLSEPYGGDEPEEM